MLEWEELPADSETKAFLLAMGRYMDDYSDAAVMIEAAYAKYQDVNLSSYSNPIQPFEWYCFSLFLKDNLRPGDLRVLGTFIASIFSEVESKSIQLASLGMTSNLPGRPKIIDETRLREIIGAVFFELKSNPNKSQAYASVAKAFHKSPDTIRRYFERWNKRKRSTGKTK